jgi:diguanylate cyclase (GGDEF)-like protein
MSLVKLVHGTMKLCADGSAVSVEDAEASPTLAALQPVVKAGSIKSLLAIAMFEGDQQLGVVVLEQCDRRRKWKPKEVAVLKNLVEQMAMAISHVKLRGLMKSLAVTDERTGMLNRGAYLDCLLAETTRATKQQGGTLSVALLQFGTGAQFVREAGQDAIKKFIEEVGQAMTSHLRPNDVAIRYDATTLALVMPDTKGPEAMVVMDKLRKLVGGIRLGDKASPPMTFGLAEPILGNGTEPVDSVTELINRVEAALEGAHKDGVGMGKLLTPEAPGL